MIVCGAELLCAKIPSPEYSAQIWYVPTGSSCDEFAGVPSGTLPFASSVYVATPPAISGSPAFVSTVIAPCGVPPPLAAFTAAVTTGTVPETSVVGENVKVVSLAFSVVLFQLVTSKFASTEPSPLARS